MWLKIKKNIGSLLSLILFGSACLYLGDRFSPFSGNSSNTETTIVSDTIPDNIIVENKEKIDSLRSLVEFYRKEAELRRDKMAELMVEKKEKIDSIKRLPLDSSVLFLKNKIIEYEKYSSIHFDGIN